MEMDRRNNQRVSPVALEGLPRDTVVTIDCNFDDTRRAVGELVATALGAVLVDYERYFRSLAYSCMEAGIHPKDLFQVARHCGHARIDTWVRNQKGQFDEALIFVNCDLFNDEELKAIPDDTPLRGFDPVARDIVRWVLQELPRDRRAVALGLDVGERIFKSTPFRFFVRSPKYTSQPPTDQSSDMAMIDGVTLSAVQSCGNILAKLMPLYQRHQANEKIG